jgi:small subunit ribosomal protein S18
VVPKIKATADGRKIVRSTGKRRFAGTPPGYEPRPAFVDFKDVSGLKKFLNGQGKLLSRKRTGLSAAYQKAVAGAVKRARFIGLLPYVAE